MKKLFASLLVATAMLSAGAASARNVPVHEAKAAAAYFMEHNSYHQGLTSEDVELVYQIDNPTLAVPACYFFNVGKEGWVIMAANTATDPVIGFSDEGSLDADCLPSNMMWFLGEYAKMVFDVQNADQDEDFPVAAEWDDLFNHKLKGITKDQQVVLMRSNWDQGANRNPTYNLYCPNVDGRYCYVGCVATALSQICYYYKYPKNPVGRPSYNWEYGSTSLSLRLDTIHFDYNNMVNKITSSTTDDQVREIAKLCYALGVTVHMQYSPEGSGAYSVSVPGWMQNYFRYKRGTLTYRANVTEEEYLNGLRSDLQRNRPVYMGGASLIGDGRDADGHAWVCAGYFTDSDQRYFMNWGWGGSGNGFYNLKANNMPVNGYNFTEYQETITGMIPPSADSTDIDFVSIDEADANVQLQPAYPNPAINSVELPYMLGADADLTVYGIDGTVVESRRLRAGEGRAVVDVRGLPAGVYIYRLGSASGKFIVR